MEATCDSRAELIEVQQQSERRIKTLEEENGDLREKGAYAVERLNIAEERTAIANAERENVLAQWEAQMERDAAEKHECVKRERDARAAAEKEAAQKREALNRVEELERELDQEKKNLRLQKEKQKLVENERDQYQRIVTHLQFESTQLHDQLTILKDQIEEGHRARE